MLTLDQILTFGLAALVLIVIPGPSVIFVIGRALAYGRGVALASVAGNSLGLLTIVVLVAFGLGVVVEESIVVFNVLKLAGAAYLVYLGVEAVRRRREFLAQDPADVAGGARRPRDGWRRAIRQGFVVGITNPKAYMILAAVLPQFVDRGAGHVQLQLLLLGLLAFAIGMVSDSAWALVASQLRSWFVGSPRRGEAVGAAGGLSMIGLGVGLALTGEGSADRDTVRVYVAAMRQVASVLHLDLDAFFAAVEQRDKPSLRGKPVVVGGVGGRGVVSTASYEARKYGVRSAMSTREARSRCPHAAFLSGRFHAYRATSDAVMAVLRETSPLVEPLSLDEAFVDLAAAQLPDLEIADRHGAGRAAARAGGRGDRRADRVGRRRHVQVHRQGRQRPRQARRPGRRTSRHRDGPPATDARVGHPGRRPGDHRAAAPRRHPHGRRPRGRQRGRAGSHRSAPRTGTPSTSSATPATTARSSPSARPSR